MKLTPYTNGKKFITVAEFAKLMQVTNEAVTRWIRERRLQAQYFIPETEVNRWMGLNSDDPFDLQVKRILERDNQPVQLLRYEATPAPSDILPRSTPDIEFMVGEVQRKCRYLESENRRLIDQNLRLKSVLRDELLLWQSILRDGKEVRFGEAKRHISRLLGATEYDGRDEGPMDYRDRELGGNLREEWYGREALPAKTDEPAPCPDDAAPKRGLKPDQWRVDQIVGENRKL